MAAFVTGLEGLVEKVALAVPVGQTGGASRALPSGIPAAKGSGLLGRGLRAMALPGLVAGGAAGAALVHENEQDERKYRQVYAPMGPGSVYGD